MQEVNVERWRRARPKRRPNAVLVVCGLLALSGEAAFAPPAIAQSAKPAGAKAATTKQASERERAKQVYKQAEDKFEAGDYAGALPLYEEANAIIPGAAPQHKTAVTLDRLGRARDAAAAYQRFLDGNPDPDRFGPKIEEAKARIASLRTTPAKITVITDPPSVPNLWLSIDGTPQSGMEFAAAPGLHTIAATADGWKGALTVDLGVGERREITLRLQKVEAPAVPEAPKLVAPPIVAAPSCPGPCVAPAPRRSNIPAYVTLGVAGAAAVVGTVFGGLSIASKNAYDDAPSLNGAFLVHRQTQLADISFAIAVSLGVAGGALLLTNMEPKPPAPAKKPVATLPVVAPYVGPSGGGGAATLRF